MASFALTFVTPILLLPTAGYFAWREAPKPVALTLGTLSLAFPAYAVVVGGDWMAMGRFLVPAFAFGALLMGWLVARLWKTPNVTSCGHGGSDNDNHGLVCFPSGMRIWFPHRCATPFIFVIHFTNT